MVFRDQMLVCEQCGTTFFFTVTQQRRMAEELGHQEFEAPKLCPNCRQQGAEPDAGDQASPVGEVAEQAPEYAEAAAESSLEPEPVSESSLEPESVSEPEPESEPVLEPAPVSTSESLPVFDESLFQDIGIKVKLIGRIKWFSRKKGFGFVTKADGEELFFHRSDVLPADMGQLRDGTQVEFDVRRTDKGLEAFDVSILPTA